MLNQRSLATVAGSRYTAEFLKPAYGSYCFAHIPDTVKALFGVPAATPLPPDVLPAASGYDHVILFLIDAFGWRFFERYADEAPFLKEMLAGGVVSQLTSQFPSTTAAHITCMNSGLPDGVSGVHEWFYYEPAVDAVIAPLLYSYAGETKPEGLTKLGVKAGDIFPDATLYLPLQAAGVQSYTFNHQSYARSSFTTFYNRGADGVPYLTWAEALVNLRLKLAQTPGRAYAYLYFGFADALLHTYGPDTPQVDAEARALLWLLDGWLRDMRPAPRTLLLVTADHGMAQVSPKTTVYLNQRLPELLPLLRVNRRGDLIRFGGSPRDLFLYVRDAALAEAEALLTQALAGQALSVKTADLIDQGFFGPPPVSQRLLDRVGNLAILPFAGEAVFWYEKDRFEQKFYGHHGGLTPEEMVIPFMAYEMER